jgi:hypothetical protein
MPLFKFRVVLKMCVGFSEHFVEQTTYQEAINAIESKYKYNKVVLCHIA